jgi:hypothetical protein
MLASLLAIIGTILCLRADGGESKKKPVNHGERRGTNPLPSTVVIRSVELSHRYRSGRRFCPPVSAIDALIDVVWKRILAEVAKTDSGLFQNNHGEVLDYYRMESEGGWVLPTSILLLR